MEGIPILALSWPGDPGPFRQGELIKTL